MNVFSELYQAQLEAIPTASKATVSKSRGMIYWDYDTQEILVADGSGLVTYQRKETEGVLGEVRSAMLTEIQFQSETNGTWVLADGRSVIGSDYETVTGLSAIPDLRGIFIRGKNNTRVDGNQNPDGDLALGTFQTDRFKSHSHTIDNGINATNGAPPGVGTNSVTPGGNSGSTGEAETSPKSVTVNYFIKINRG